MTYTQIPTITTATFNGIRVHVAFENTVPGAASLYMVYPMPGKVGVDGLTVFEGITADQLTEVRTHETWEDACRDGIELLTVGEAKDRAFAAWTRGEWMTAEARCNFLAAL